MKIKIITYTMLLECLLIFNDVIKRTLICVTDVVPRFIIDVTESFWPIVQSDFDSRVSFFNSLQCYVFSFLLCLDHNKLYQKNTPQWCGTVFVRGSGIGLGKNWHGPWLTLVKYENIRYPNVLKYRLSSGALRTIFLKKPPVVIVNKYINVSTKFCIHFRIRQVVDHKLVPVTFPFTT